MMKKLFSFLTLIFIGIGFTGCPKRRPSTNEIDTIIKTYKTEFERDQIKYDCYVRGRPIVIANPITCNETVAPNKPLYATDARRIRDDVTHRFFTAIDSNYNMFVDDLQNRRATTNFLGDLTELSAGVAIGITNGERALHILGTALTAFKGGRKSIDKNFYERQSTPILITKMDASRAKVMSSVLIKKDKYGTDKYSLEYALGDVVNYFWAGTLTRAFVELSKDSGIAARTAEENLSKVEGVPISSIPTIAAQRVSDEITTQRNSLSNQLSAAFASNPPTGAKPAIITKHSQIWTDIEADKEFNSVVTELKGVTEFASTIGKLDSQDISLTKRDINRLFASFLRKIIATDTAAKNTRLQEMYLNLLKTHNK